MTTTTSHLPRRRPGRPPGGALVADREQLLAAAERAVAAFGPEVTMEAIAAEAKVTKPILYRSVGDKEAVARSLAERLVDRINDAVTAATDAAAPAQVDDPAATLRRFVLAVLSTVEQERNLYLFVTSAGSGTDPLGQALRLADRSAEPMAERLLAGGAASERAGALAWSYGIIGLLHFALVWWLRDQAISRDDLADQLSALLWTGLRGQ